MRRKTKSPKGQPRAAATRGGRGRGRTRGGSKASSETLQRETQVVSQFSSIPGKVNNNTSRRGAYNKSLDRKDNQNIILNGETSPANGNEAGASSSSNGEQRLGTNNSDPTKPFSDQFYLHKKFKKLTTTVTSDVGDVTTASCSSKNSFMTNGFKSKTEYTSNTSDINCTNVNSSDSGHYSRNESAMDISVTKPITQSISSASEANFNPNLAGSSNNMVYKPKFRISTDTEVKPEPNCSGYSSAASTSTRGEEPERKCSGEPGKIGKSLRIDRQSLDDRISKIIVENQSLLEWPEHFTKKLKSHTSRNSQSHNHHQRTNQLTIMSGGSTTELPPASSNSSHRLHQPHNGLVRHSSFDMTSSGGTVEFLPASPLLMKPSSEILNSTFTQAVQSSPRSSDFSSSVSDLSFPVVSAVTSALIVPKKRRRLSPTPSRLCGGEVSELPVSDVLSSKNYYQDVDMTVRVSNCSGAKVTIRTNNGGSGGCVQSAVSFGRFIDTVPSPLPLNTVTKTLFYPSHIGPSLDDKCLPLVKEEVMDPKELDSNKKSRGRNSRKKFNNQSSAEALQLDKKAASFEENTSCDPSKGKVLPSFIRSSSNDKCKDSPDILDPVSTPSSNPSKTPFQVLQNSATNAKRPNFLALKPVNSVLKKSDVGVLPSPETPRVAKSYNQMFINGNAYTYLGFKVSTRSSYTCLFKPQPMSFENTDTKLSMYSNWQPCPKDPKEMEVSMSTNDSRVNGRKSPQSLYTSAVGRNCDTMTVSSPSSHGPISSPMAEKNPLSIFASNSIAPITSLSRSSEAVSQSPPSKSLLSPTMASGSQHLGKKNGELAFIGPSSPGSSSNGSHFPLLKSSNSAPVISSSSDNDLSSADESSSYGRKYLKRSRNEDFISDAPLALTTKSKRDSVSSLMRDDSNSATDSMKSEVVMNRSDGSRVRIMEGGFESNEDYTYVRGRGRGRYVCGFKVGGSQAACGIRCKKPSMLRKHLKTHTDLRPYTCKLCNFSFKTKGNLTKHQKSKSHHKKCISMGIHPESSQSLATIGPSISDTNSENDSEEEDEDDNGDESDLQADDDANSSIENDNESVEKEIALSLLDLSRVSRLDVGYVDDIESDRRTNIEQPGSLTFAVNSMLEDRHSIRESSVPISSTEAPIDLSIKAKPKLVNEEPEPKRLKIERNGFVRSVGVVGEAQLWEPEEELISKGCLNLKKVLNTGSPSKENRVDEVPLSREIKQEIFEFPIENTERLRNGYVTELSLTKPESETSNSSSPSHSLKPATEINSTAEESSPAASSGTNNVAPVKLHQPWLSPPEKNSKDSDKEVDVEIDVKMGPVSLEDRARIDALEELCIKSGGHASNFSGETASPNSNKLFSSLSGLRPQAEFRQPSGAQALVKDEGKAECSVCAKQFIKASQLTLHMNIHYLERPFRCDPCGVSFRTKGHLIKHRRSSSHDCKVYLTEAWGVANEENPRPFKCPDCKIAFRIHGHLAKHLRSKMHIMRMECLGKLPFGIYFEMEKSGMNLNEIDTTDCDMSLVSLQTVARKIYGETWMERLTIPVEEPAV